MRLRYDRLSFTGDDRIDSPVVVCFVPKWIYINFMCKQLSTEEIENRWWNNFLIETEESSCGESNISNIITHTRIFMKFSWGSQAKSKAQSQTRLRKFLSRCYAFFVFVCFLSAHFTRSATPHTGCLCCMAKINCIARLVRAQSFTWKFSSVRWSLFVGGAVNSPLRSRLITLCCFLYIFRRIDCFFSLFFSSQLNSQAREFFTW